MALGDDVRNYLIAQGVTDTVKIGALPLTPDVVVAVIASGGSPPRVAMGPTVLQRELSVQVLSRAAQDGYQACETLALQVHTILLTVGPVTLNGTVYRLIEAVDEPAYLGTDENERPMFSANYDLVIGVA